LIGGGRVIAVIPARAGSKSIKNKNLHSLGGKPLLAWPIDAAKKTEEIDRIIVSTDGEKIAAEAQQRGVEVYDRPESLASDASLVIDTLKDLIGRLRSEGEQAKYMVVLEPTCPFRKPKDISNCLNMLVNNSLDSVATFSSPELNPHRAWRIENDAPVPFIEGSNPWQPRQMLPEAWQLNGAVYAFHMDKLKQSKVGLLFGKIGAVTMPLERSVDIDNIVDFHTAESLLNRSELINE
jgi:CMP-N,N'-diacetyllegionaminic acid synthase